MGVGGNERLKLRLRVGQKDVPQILKHTNLKPLTQFEAESGPEAMIEGIIQKELGSK
jgi:hypothetical protein